MKIRIKRSLLSFLLIMVLLLSANLSYSIIAQKTGIAPVTTAQAATYSNSPLVTYTNLTANHSGTRNHVIDTITIHSMAAPWTGKRCADYFANETTAASSNYCIGKDGDIALSVEEKNRSWATSSSSNDHRAITIEVATTTAAQNPNYPCTDAAYNALINLLVDICQRNNIKKLLWKNDKSLIGNVAQQNMTVHQWYANKACPGPYLLERHGAIADAVNARLAPDVSSCEHRNDWNSILVSFNVANNNYSQTGQNLPLDKIIYTDASGNDKLNVEGGGAFWIDANYLGIRTPSPAVGDKITLKAGFQWGSLTLGSDTAYTITALNSACSPNLKVKSFNHSNDWNSFIVEFATPNNNYSVAGTDLDTSKLVYTSSAGVDKSARGWFWLDSTHLGIRTEGVNAVAAGDIVAIKSGFVWGGSSVAHDIIYTAQGANQGCIPGGTILTGGSSGETGGETGGDSTTAPMVVTFNSNGGSNVANQTINSGALATKPASPTKAGYTFVGWYTNSELTDEFDFSAPITANTTLYAKWQQIMYNVAFNSNEGSSVSSQTITYGGTVTRPTNPTKTGYTFVGWYNDSALTDEFDFSSPITEDTTLYAKWQQVVYRYTVTFNSNGGSNVITQTVNGGGLAIIPNNPTKDGYTFAGWYKDSALTSEFNFNTPITANTTLYAKWQKNADEGSESTISCNSNVAGTSIGISLSALLIAGCIIVAKRKSKQK